MLSVQAAPIAHIGWLKAKTKCALTDDFNAIEAVDSSGAIRGMVGYCNWTPKSVMAHMAVLAPTVWRSLLRPALAYPFIQVGVENMLGLIPAGNERSVQFAKHIGFVEKYRLKDGWDAGEDLLLLQLTKDGASRFLCANERAA